MPRQQAVLPATRLYARVGMADPRALVCTPFPRPAAERATGQTSQTAACRGRATTVAAVTLPAASVDHEIGRPVAAGQQPPATSAGSIMADKIAQEDDPGNLSTQTQTLVNRPVGGGGGGGGGGMRANPVGPLVPRDYSAAYRSLGYGSNESAGQTQVKTPQGPSQHGSDVPGAGVPAPAETAGAAGAEAGGGVDAAGGAAATGAAAGLEELAPLALAL